MRQKLYFSIYQYFIKKIEIIKHNKIQSNNKNQLKNESKIY